MKRHFPDLRQHRKDQRCPLPSAATRRKRHAEGNPDSASTTNVNRFASPIPARESTYLKRVKQKYYHSITRISTKQKSPELLGKPQPNNQNPSNSKTWAQGCASLGTSPPSLTAISRPFHSDGNIAALW